MNINQFLYYAVAFTFCFCYNENKIYDRCNCNNTIEEEKGTSVLEEKLFKEKSYISLKNAGINGDGVTDVTLRLQQVLNKYDTVFFPKGSYSVNTSLDLKTGQVIMGDGLANLVNKSNAIHFSFFSITSKENISISKINFIAKAGNKNIVYGIHAANIRGLTIRNVRTENAGLLLINEPAGGYVKATSYKPADISAASTNVYIDACRCTGSTSARTNTSGVIFYFADNWRVTNSSFSNYQHGIQWWGGDSNPERNGDTSNIRKARNGVIENVTVNNVAAGGIWGSMGENIAVSGCKVSNCGDVGIDFEGCFNCTAINNSVKDCNNGCIATFHFNKNILFDSNVMDQTTSSRPLSCIYNSSQTQHNATIRYVNNVFSSANAVGFIYQQGPSNNIVFEKNKLMNVVLNLQFNNNKIVTIRNNELTFSMPINNYNYIIKAGETNNNGQVVIENNSIISKVKQPPSVSAIYTYQADYNSSPVTRIYGNIITGVSKKFTIEWNGANPGVTSKTYINTTDVISEKEFEIIDNTKRSEVFINNKKL